MYPSFSLINGNFLYIKKAAIEASINGLKSLIEISELTVEKDNDEYFELLEVSFQQLVPAVILMATAIEGYVNAYGKYLISSNEFKIYDKLGTPDKLALFYRFKTGNEINRGTKLFEDIKKLFSLRNKIVHEKPKIIKVDNGSVFNIDLMGIRSEVLLGAKDFIDVFDRMSDLIAEIEECDKCPIISMTFSNPKEYKEKAYKKIDEFYDPIADKINEIIKVLGKKINDYEEKNDFV